MHLLSYYHRLFNKIVICNVSFILCANSYSSNLFYFLRRFTWRRYGCKHDISSWRLLWFMLRDYVFTRSDNVMWNEVTWCDALQHNGDAFMVFICKVSSRVPIPVRWSYAAEFIWRHLEETLIRKNFHGLCTPNSWNQISGRELVLMFRFKEFWRTHKDAHPQTQEQWHTQCTLYGNVK